MTGALNRPICIAMVVTDANDATGSTRRDEKRRAPVLHPAVENLLEGLRERKDIKVEVIYGKREPIPEEERIDGCLHFVPVPYRPLFNAGMGGSFVGRALALLKYLWRSRPDIIHAQGTEREPGLVAALAGMPSILTLHGNFRELAKCTGARTFSYFGICALLEGFILPRVTGVHCLTEHTLQSVAAKARRTWVIPNSAAEVFFKVNRFPSPSPSVVCVADIAEWKNQVVLVEASDRLYAEFPESKVHFFGSCDPLHRYGDAFVKAISSRQWCVYHGNCSREQILSALSGATCLVLPSLMENCPMSVVEAVAAGVPVIGANVGGIPDLVRSDENGWLFSARDTSELGELLVRLHRDPSIGERMSAIARNMARSRFAHASVAERHVTMYRELLPST